MKSTRARTLSEGILFMDFYQLTMAQLYFRQGLHETPAQFDYFFRNYPDYGKHQSGFCVNAGLKSLYNWMQEVSFQSEDIQHLRAHKDAKGNCVFQDDFLKWLQKYATFDRLSIWAIPEGRLVHPQTPIVIVRGPLGVAQLLESSLLNHLNYQTLVATKAARIRQAGQDQLLIDFGMRRAQSWGANAGTRAAIIGGADFSSNTGASYALGYPPKGTHAHSMVQAFIALGRCELDAFEAYAGVYPDDCLLLVDTIDTLQSGIPNAIKVFRDLKEKGHQPKGIRLDSGDLAYLSVQAAKMLNAEGFDEVSIVLSNQLDELVLWQILNQIRVEAPRNGLDADHLISRLVYGVGTSLMVSKGAGALDGVYKLTGIYQDGEWKPSLKLSESPGKIINPGFKYVWRIYDQRRKAVMDLMTFEEKVPFSANKLEAFHPVDLDKKRIFSKKEISSYESLLVQVTDQGHCCYAWPQIEEIRKRRQQDLEKLDEGVKRLINPHLYHVSLSEKLADLKKELIAKAGKSTRDKRE